MSTSAENRLHESIGERLRRLRTERRLSQRELSAPGVSYAYISRIEAGSRQPSVKALRKLAAKLGVTPDYLETGEVIRAADRRELDLVEAELELRLADETGPAEERLRAVLDEAVAAADVEGALRARVVLGMAAVETGRPAEAVALLEEAIADGMVRPAAHPDVYSQLGHAYAALGEVRRAIALYSRCLDEVEQDEPENVAARVQFATRLGYALSDTGDAAHAQQALVRVLDSAGALVDPAAQAMLYRSLARRAALRGELGSALAHARRALALLDATANAAQLGRAHLLSGVILLTEGKADEAGTQLDLAESLLGVRPASGDLASLRTEQARREVFLGDGRSAARRAREALELLDDTDPGEQGRAWQALAEGLALDGDVAEAIDAFRNAVDSLERARRYPAAAQACRAWGRMLRDAGREGDALDVLDRAAELAGRRREGLHLHADG